MPGEEVMEAEEVNGERYLEAAREGRERAVKSGRKYKACTAHGPHTRSSEALAQTGQGYLDLPTFSFQF